MTQAARSNLATVESTGSVLDFNVLRFRKAFEDMETWLFSTQALTMAEHEVETDLETRGREVLRLMLQAHVYRRGTGDVGPAIEVCRDDGAPRRCKAARTDDRNIISIFGGVKARRTAYAARGCAAVHPADEQMRLPARSFSYEMQRRIVDEAVRGPYDEATESVRNSTGNVVAKRSAEQIVADASEDFDAFYARRTAPPAETTGPILVGAVDCKGVPMVKQEQEGVERKVRRGKGEKANKKKMSTVAAVYTSEPRVRTPEEVVKSLFDGERPSGRPAVRPERKRVWASLKKSKEDVIAEVAAEMRARDPEGEKLWSAVADGERALQKLVRRLLPGVLLILDFLHALEKLWKAAHAFFGEGSPEAAQWVRSHALMILRGKAGQVVKGMRQSVTKRKLRGARKKAVLDAAGYLYRNRVHMRYHEYLAKGLPIASGAVEGACKNLVKDRFERSGMRWVIGGAEAVLRLRAIKLSGDTNEYWRFHIKQDQKRLYGQNSWKIAS